MWVLSVFLTILTSLSAIKSDDLRMGYHKMLIGINKTGVDLVFMPGITIFDIPLTKKFLESFDDFDFIVLVTNSRELQLQTMVIAEMVEIPAIIVGKGTDSKWSFFTEPDLGCYQRSLNGLIEWLKMDKFAIFYSATDQNIENASFIKNQFNYAISSGYHPSASVDTIVNHLGKFFKAEGVQNFVVLPDLTDCYALVHSFNVLNLEKEWNLIIYGEECFLYMKTDGSLSLAYSDLDTAFNERRLEMLAITKFTNKISGKNIARFQIMNEFAKVKKPCTYSIMNRFNNRIHKVGSILDGVVTVSEEITFFGNKFKRTKLNSIPITISADTNCSLPGQYDARQNQLYHQGTKFMINYINTKNPLKGFEFKLFDDFNCKNSSENKNFSTCLASLGSQLGVAHIPSFYYPSVLAIEGLRRQGLRIPVVNGMGATLKNFTLPSSFFRVVSTLDVILQYSAHILKVFGNLNVIVFYSDDAWGKMIYSHLLYLDQEKVLNIINRPQFREIPMNFSSDMWEEFKENFEDAFETGCYFIVLAMSHPTPFNFLEALYDHGIRRGDFSYFFVTPAGLDALKVQDSLKIKKRKELLHGSHFLYGSFWTGKYGEELRKEYENSNFETWLPCYYMDAVLSIIKAVELVLLSGKDYEDHELITKSIKASKFLGVTGMILFDEDSLSREINSVSFYNMFEDPSTGEFLIKESARASPTSLNYLKLEKSVWPLGETHPKSMKDYYLNCDFFNYKVTQSDSSIFKETLLNLAVLVISALISLLWILKFKLISIPMLATVKFIEPDDYLEIIAVIFEPFQMISLGPSMMHVSVTFGRYLNIFSFNWLKAFEFRDKVYWTLLCLIIVSLIISLVFLMVSRLKLKLIENHRGKFLKIESLIKLVVINFLFIPIFSYLSSVFSCRFSQMSHGAFLDNDCSYECWNRSHLILVSICMFLLVTHSVLSYFYKSGEQDNLTKNIKASQAFFMLKTFLCILITTLEKVFIILGIMEKIWFALVFLTGMAAILVFLMKNNAYNFDRLNLWVKVGYFCVVWNTLMYVVAVCTEVNRVWIVGVDIIGWSVIFGLGIRKNLKLPPSLLVAKEGKTVYQMIKLAFNFGLFQRLLVYRIKNKDFMKRMRKD